MTANRARAFAASLRSFPTLRVAIQALAGVLGGCQSLHTDSMDETLGLPTETAVRVALRTQQIVAHESGVHRTVDPLGGSWFVEALTDRMEADAQAMIREIDTEFHFGNRCVANSIVSTTSFTCGSGG